MSDLLKQLETELMLDQRDCIEYVERISARVDVSHLKKWITFVQQGGLMDTATIQNFSVCGMRVIAEHWCMIPKEDTLMHIRHGDRMLLCRMVRKTSDGFAIQYIRNHPYHMQMFFEELLRDCIQIGAK